MATSGGLVCLQGRVISHTLFVWVQPLLISSRPVWQSISHMLVTVRMVTPLSLCWLEGRWLLNTSSLSWGSYLWRQAGDHWTASTHWHLTAASYGQGRNNEWTMGHCQTAAQNLNRSMHNTYVPQLLLRGSDWFPFRQQQMLAASQWLLAVVCIKWSVSQGTSFGCL